MDEPKTVRERLALAKRELELLELAAEYEAAIAEFKKNRTVASKNRMHELGAQLSEITAEIRRGGRRLPVVTEPAPAPEKKKRWFS